MAYIRLSLFICLVTLFSCKTPDGKPLNGGNHQYTNNLINESSPYLLQHAHNPVEWNPWNEETLARAKKENKMLIISVGYSSR